MRIFFFRVLPLPCYLCSPLVLIVVGRTSGAAATSTGAGVTVGLGATLAMFVEAGSVDIGNVKLNVPL